MSLKQATELKSLVLILTVGTSLFFITQPYCFGVGGNLLQELPKEINKKNDSVSSSPPISTSLVPRTRSRSPMTPNGVSVGVWSDLRLYTTFIGEFTELMKWTSAVERLELLFPSKLVDLEICAYLRVTLLGRFGLQTNCLTNNLMLANTNNKSRNLVLQNVPLISLHFLKTENSTESIIPAKFLIHYRASRPILVLTGNETDGDLLVQQLQPEVNSNFKWTLAYQFGPVGDDVGLHARIRVVEIYGFATSSEPLLNSIGFWSLGMGLQIDAGKRNGPTNFMGRLIRVTSVEGQPVVYLKTNKTTGELDGRGYLPDILTVISSHLNFTYILLSPSDKSFGSVDESGNWSGMVGMLQRKEAEMALMSFSLTAARKLAMEFSPAVEYSSTRLLIRRDFQVNELKWNVFLEPFHWSVWFAIPITILFGSLCLRILRNFQQLETTPADSAWLLSCCFLLQGLDDHSLFRKLPSRIVLGSFWLLAVVIYASYTARLTSFLAATTDPLPFKSLAEAVQNRNWKIGLVKGSSFQDRVKESRAPEMRLFSRSLEQDSSRLVSGFREGVDRVFSEKFIFLTSDLVPSFMIKDNCSYTWIPGRYFPGFGYMGYQKNLPFASAVSHRVSRIRETGQMRRLVRKWWGDGGGGCSVAEDFLGMSLYETGTAFFILLIAFSVSLLLLSAEIGFANSRGTSHKHTSSSTTLFVSDSARPGIDVQFPNTQLDKSHLSLRTTTETFTYSQGEFGEGESQRNFLNSNPYPNPTIPALSPEPSSFGNFWKRIGNSRKTKLPRFHEKLPSVLN